MNSTVDKYQGKTLLHGEERSVRNWGNALPLLVCLALALWAQRALDQRTHEMWAFAVYGLAAVLFVWACSNRKPERLVSEEDRESLPYRGKLLVVGLAVIIGGVSFPLFEGNRFTPGNVLLWGSGLILLWWVSRDRGSGGQSSLARWRDRFSPEGIRIPWATLALVGSMLLGAFYRLYRLAEIPAEMGCDLPLIYANVKMILEGEHLIFFPLHPGREGLFFYLIAPFARLFGLNHHSIKFVGACIGILTIPMLYLLVRELFGREAGLYAAFFLAVAKWHVILSRTGFRAILMPLFLILVWYGLVRAMRTGRRKWFFWTGGALGLGLYTYNAFLLMPVAVLLCLGAYAVVNRGRFLRKHWGDVLLLFLVALYVFIPLGRYACDEPQMYLYRVATRITGAESALSSNVLRVLLDNLRKTALMLNYEGDIVFYTNVPFQRHLGYLSGILFVFGLAYAVARWRSGHNVLTLVFLFCTMLPTALSIAFPAEVPNATRASGAIVPAYVLVGGALAVLRQGLWSSLPGARSRRLTLDFRVSNTVDWHVMKEVNLGARHLAAVGLAAFLVLEAGSVYPVYFDQYVTHLPFRNYSITLDMARTIDDFADDGLSYIVPMPYWYDGNAVRAQLRIEDQDWRNEVIALQPDEPPLSILEGEAMFILHPNDDRSLGVLRGFFPKGVALQHIDYDGNTSFITFYGER